MCASLHGSLLFFPAASGKQSVTGGILGRGPDAVKRTIAERA